MIARNSCYSKLTNLRVQQRFVQWIGAVSPWWTGLAIRPPEIEGQRVLTGIEMYRLVASTPDHSFGVPQERRTYPLPCI